MRLSPRTASRCLLVLVGAFSLLIQPLHLTERTFDFSIARVLPEFLIGVLAYRARVHLIAWAGNVNITFSGAIAFFILCVVAMTPDALIVAGLVIVIVCGAAITGSLATALSWRPLLYLGEISYSLYLVHAFVLSATYSAFKIPRIAAYVPASLRDVARGCSRVAPGKSPHRRGLVHQALCSPPDACDRLGVVVRKRRFTIS